MQVVRCQCGMVYNKNQPSEDVLSEFYEESKALETWSQIKESDKEQLRQREKYFDSISFLCSQRVNSIVDVGCGNGTFLQMYGQQKPLAFLKGTEPNSAARGECARKGLSVDEWDIDIFNEANTKMYDAITLWGVLEHLKRPQEQIRKLGSHIRIGGYLLFCVPNVDSRVVRQLWRDCFTFCPQHLWYFDLMTLRNFMKSIGFEPVFQYTIEPEAGPILRASFGFPPYGEIPDWIRFQYLKPAYLKNFGKVLLDQGTGYKLIMIGKKQCETMPLYPHGRDQRVS